MSVIFYEPFTANLNFFDTVAADSGDFAWTASGPEGHPGIQVEIDDTTIIYGRKNHTALTTQTDARFGTYFDLSTLSLPSGASAELFGWRTSGATVRLRLRVFNNAGTISFIHDFRGDDGSNSQGIVSLAGATALRWEIHVSKTNGESKLYWDTGGSGLLLKDTRSKVITNTFDDQTDISFGVREAPSASITGHYLMGPVGFRDDATEIGPYDWNTAPVLSVTPTENGIYDEALELSAISWSDAENDVDTVELSITNGATITADLTGTSVTVTAGSNDSAAMTLEGTNADLLTVLSTTKLVINMADPGISVWDLDTVLSVAITDAGSLVDSANITISWTPENGIGTSSYEWTGLTAAQIATSVQAGVEITPETDNMNTITGNMYGGLSTTPVLSDSKQFTIIVNSIVNTIPRVILPETQTAFVDTPKTIPPIVLEDDEDNIFQVNILCTGGTIEVTEGGGSVLSSGANESAAMSYDGTLTQLNILLATIVYTPTESGVQTIDIIAVDDESAFGQETLEVSVSPATQSTAKAGFFQIF